MYLPIHWIVVNALLNNSTTIHPPTRNEAEDNNYVVLNCPVLVPTTAAACS